MIGSPSGVVVAVEDQAGGRVAEVDEGAQGFDEVVLQVPGVLGEELEDVQSSQVLGSAELDVVF